MGLIHYSFVILGLLSFTCSDFSVAQSSGSAHSEPQTFLKEQAVSQGGSNSINELIRTGNIRGLRDLDQQGARFDVTLPGPISPVRLAVSLGDVNILRFLLSQPEVVNPHESEKLFISTILELAVTQNNNYEVMVILLEDQRFPFPDIETRVGFQEFSNIIEDADIRTLDLIFKTEGVDVNSRDPFGNPLFLAFLRPGRLDIVDYFLDHPKFRLSDQDIRFVFRHLASISSSKIFKKLFRLPRFHEALNPIVMKLLFNEIIRKGDRELVEFIAELDEFDPFKKGPVGSTFLELSVLTSGAQLGFLLLRSDRPDEMKLKMIEHLLPRINETLNEGQGDLNRIIELDFLRSAFEDFKRARTKDGGPVAEGVMQWE